jgi:hypothetical protein
MEKIEIKTLLDEFIESIDLNEEDKKRFIPIWNKNNKLLVQLIFEFSEQQFNRGKDQSIELGYMD